MVKKIILQLILFSFRFFLLSFKNAKEFFYKTLINYDNQVSEAVDQFELAKTLSEEYIDKYPDSVDMLYWNLANMSNWAKAIGVRAVSQLGAADEYRERAVDIIILNPEYEDGGGFFLLGAVYYTAPYIPLLLNWPNNDRAIKYFSKAFSNSSNLKLFFN